MNDRERRELRYSECAVLAFWCGGIELLRIAQAPLGRLAMIYATVIASIALINSLRTLGAHKYQSDGEVLSKASQIADSIDTPDSWFAFVWAPAGLRFHALHHLFPTVPYHNLSKLYERILQRRHQPYLQSVVSPALRSSLKNLWSDTHV
jgi:fatty acid desaturase